MLTRRRSANYKWLVVGMLWFICFFNYADRQAIFSVFPILKHDYHFNDEELGRIAMAFTLVYALTAPFAGQVGDRFARKTVILAGLYIWSAITGLTSVCTRVWHFVLVRGSEGLGETFYFPASMSLVSDYHSGKTRSRAMSLHQTSVYAGTIGGGALAGWMAQRGQWRECFVLLGVLGVALGFVLAAFLREPQRNEAEAAERTDTGAEVAPASIPFGRFLRSLVETPTALLLVLAFFGANAVALVFLSWMPLFLNEKFKMTLTSAGVGATFFIQVGSMIGSALGGFLADRWRRIHPGGRILVQATGTLAGAPFLFWIGSAGEVGPLIVAMSAFGITKGLYDSNIWASLYDVVPVARRGTAVGLMNMIGWLGGALGAYTIGAAVQARRITMSGGIASTSAVYLAVCATLLVAALVHAPRDMARIDP
jgi:MFS family permease